MNRLTIYNRETLKSLTPFCAGFDLNKETDEFIAPTRTKSSTFFDFHEFLFIKLKLFLRNIYNNNDLKNLVTIRINEIFPCLVCYGQKLKFSIRKLGQR